MATDNIPSPAPGPWPPAPERTLTLPAEINSATRQIHTQLNRLITSRLPLCLPPHATSPDIYAIGIQHFSAVYFEFEHLWWQSFSRLDASNHVGMEHFLRDLLPPGLIRSKRLREDIRILARTDRAPCSSKPRGTSPKLQRYIAHIRRSVTAKPHVLVAYAWVMYMAIFSGGRWIRAQLKDAGTDFWHCDVTPPLYSGMPGYHFLHFDGEEDGEDIKADFKARLEEADSILTLAQREDVVSEAVEIFRFSIALVEELDALVAGSRQWQCPKTTTLQETPPSHHRIRAFTPSFAGLAVVVSFLSWYAFYKITV